MKIQFANGRTLDCQGVRGAPISYQGVTRDCLTFLFLPDTDLGELLTLFTPENCRAVSLAGDEAVFIHEHYTLRVAAGIGDKALTEGSAAVVGGQGEQVCYVSMAQTTLAERQLLAQQEVLDGLLLASLEAVE